MDQPRWFVHSRVGNFFDVAYVDLQVDQPAAFSCVNDRFSSPEGRIDLGSDVFVVGYPQGIGLFGIFPVWKRGSVATEVSLPTDGHPKFLVDATGRSGMSGAPVYRVQRGFIASGAGLAVGGVRKEFLGVYTGRAALEGKESSELGFVWRESVVREVLSSAVLDEKPEPGKGAVTYTETFGKAAEGEHGQTGAADRALEPAS